VFCNKTVCLDLRFVRTGNEEPVAFNRRSLTEEELRKSNAKYRAEMRKFKQKFKRKAQKLFEKSFLKNIAQPEEL
jgi:hypothetical protein